MDITEKQQLAQIKQPYVSTTNMFLSDFEHIAYSLLFFCDVAITITILITISISISIPITSIAEKEDWHNFNN